MVEKKASVIVLQHIGSDSPRACWLIADTHVPGRTTHQNDKEWVKGSDKSREHGREEREREEETFLKRTVAPCCVCFGGSPRGQSRCCQLVRGFSPPFQCRIKTTDQIFMILRTLCEPLSPSTGLTLVVYTAHMQVRHKSCRASLVGEGSVCCWLAQARSSHEPTSKSSSPVSSACPHVLTKHGYTVKYRRWLFFLKAWRRRTSDTDGLRARSPTIIALMRQITFFGLLPGRSTSFARLFLSATAPNPMPAGVLGEEGGRPCDARIQPCVATSVWFADRRR